VRAGSFRGHAHGKFLGRSFGEGRVISSDTCVLVFPHIGALFSPFSGGIVTKGMPHGTGSGLGMAGVATDAECICADSPVMPSLIPCARADSISALR